MTTYAVTGSTGHLGRLVVQELLARGVPATDVVALARTPEKAATLGVPVRPVDYSDPASLPEALAGVDVLLLVSGNEVGKRLSQHTAVIEAAKAAGVQRVAYTSIANADHSANPLTPEHKATEDVLRASGLPFTILRDNWYLENYTAQLPVQLEHGVVGAAGEGRISAAARADFAEAAAVALLADDSAGRVYELAGDESFTMADYAATLTEQTGQQVSYVDLPEAEYAAVLESAGVPAGFAAILADGDRGVSEGELYDDSGTLSALIGRPTTPLTDAVKAALV